MRAPSARLPAAGLLAVLLGLGGNPGALAYERYGATPSGAGCADCHPGFADRGPLHDLHVGPARMTNNCLLCHTTTGDNPQTSRSGDPEGQGCRGCHGVNNDTDSGWGTGLRAHHRNAGAPPDSDGRRCAMCHPFDPDASPENTLPVYYGRGDVGLYDPCATATPGGEDWDGDGSGLDNDGDLGYEVADADCAATGVAAAPADAPTSLLASPNPFRQTTVLLARGSAAGPAMFEIYDAAGRLVRRHAGRAAGDGRRTFAWDGTADGGAPLPAGVYFARAGDAWTRVVRLR